jgi:ribonuclease Z
MLQAALQAVHGTRVKSILQIIKELQPDQIFTFPDGSSLTGKETTHEAIQGRKVVIMGDTCSGEHIADLVQDADVLVHEATNAHIHGYFHGDITPSQLENETRSRMHSTPQMAGTFAAETKAKQLILTHFSPRFRGDHAVNQMQTMWKIEDAARETSGLLGPNKVIAAWDLMKLAVPRPGTQVE